MTRSQLDYILSLARLQSFGKAADACFVTQSTLSAMVAKFEQQNGVTIFNRKTRPVSLTPQGEKVIKSLKSIQREFQLLDEQINEIKGYETGHLSIAGIPTVAPYLYPLILNNLSRTFKKVNFIIHEYTTEQIIEGIIDGNIDVGIVSTPLENKELIEFPLYKEDFLIYDYNSQSKSAQYSVADIDIERLWLLEEGHCLRNQVVKICELRHQKKINGNLTYSCGSIFTLVEMVKKNRGVTLLPRLAASDNHQINKTCLHSIEGSVPTREIGLVTHKNFIKNRMLTYLMEIIKKAVSEQLSTSVEDYKIFKPF